MRSSKGVLGVIVLAAVVAAGPAFAQQSTSAPLAVELTKLMDAQNLTSVAAVDPAGPGTYIAASYLPGIQLLVVSAQYPVPPALDRLIKDKNYSEAYLELNGAAVPDTKLFIQDLKADGLRPERKNGGPFDIAYEKVVKQVSFDGDWKKHQMKEDDYRSQFTAVDTRYAEMLRVLIGELKK